MIVRHRNGFPELANFDALFESLIPTRPQNGWRWSTFAPAADVRETANGYLIELDVPGLSEKEIAITLENRVLSLKGERKQPEDVKFTRQERPYGAFERQFRLPDDADTARIEARCRNGVLVVEIPRLEEAKPKTIEIKVS